MNKRHSKITGRFRGVPKPTSPEEMSFYEIADELHMTRQNVQRIYERAMGKLRAYFNSDARRQTLKDLLEELPGDPGHVAPSDRRFPLISCMHISPVPTTTGAVQRALRALENL